MISKFKLVISRDREQVALGSSIRVGVDYYGPALTEVATSYGEFCSDVDRLKAELDSLKPNAEKFFTARQ